MPAVAQMGALLLLPASGAAAFVAIGRGTHAGAGRPWPLIVPAFAPVIIMASRSGSRLMRRCRIWRSPVRWLARRFAAAALWLPFRRDHSARAEHLRADAAYREQRASRRPRRNSTRAARLTTRAAIQSNPRRTRL
jgi:hypothetical protein